MSGVFMDASFHDSSCDTIGAMSAVGSRPYRHALMSSHETVHTDLYIYVCGGKGGDKKLPCPLSAAGDTAVFSRRRPYRPALMSSHETVHTDLYMWGEGG
jgi:hypothetical protein